eukprot:262014-Prorocentrum_minimum.AAC.1
MRLIACVDGPWGKPLWQARGASPWGEPYGVGRHWTLGMALGAPLGGVGDRLNDCEFVMALGAFFFGKNELPTPTLPLVAHYPEDAEEAAADRR